jgi:hypothetical protein
MSVWVIGILLVGASAILVAWLGWNAHSPIVRGAYIVVGGPFAALPWIVWSPAAGVNGAPPALPDPLPNWIGNLYVFWTEGPLNAVETVGAVMFLVGIAALARWARIRRPSTSSDTAGAGGDG